MHSLLRRFGLREAAQTEAPSLLVSLLIAELFYKFHSFLLETGAFLVTWYALGWLHTKLRHARSLSAGSDIINRSGD
jgi:hypothetical protein